MSRMVARSAIDNRKVAITARGNSSDSEVYEQFGRTYWLLIYSETDDSWEAIDNSCNRKLNCGAGIATAELLVQEGVAVVLTGETGPNAFRTLSAAGILVVQNVVGRVKDALQDWQGGCLSFAQSANDVGSPNCLLERCRT